jgi:hypothetical protein
MSALRIARRCAIAAIVLIGTPLAHADLLIGDFQGLDGTGPILRFADSADGAAAPAGSFYTNLNGGNDVLRSAASMTFEPAEDVVYVADFYGQAIRVYAAGASGDAVPLRTLNPLQLGQPRQVAVSLAHQELIAATACCVETYLRFDSGNSAYPQRYLPSGNTAEGSRTRLNNPGGIVLRASSDEVAVPDSGVGPGNASFGVVLIFPRSVTGNSAPTRTLQGAQTLLGVAALGITYDPSNDEFLVLSQDSAQSPYGYRINAFAGSASGDAAPLRSISGANTLLGNVHAIFYDDAAEVLYASAGGENGTPARVLAFARGADGDVAPDRVIVADGSSFVFPQGITAVSDDIFKNGFN